MTVFITITDLTISAFVLVLSLFILAREPKRKINQIFGVTIFFFASWIVCSSLSDITGFYGSVFWALWFARAAIIGPFLFCPLFVYFTYYFPRERHPLSWWKTIGLFLIPLVGVAFFPTDYNVASVTLEPWGTGFDPGALYLVLLICLLGYFGFGLYRLIKAYRRTRIYHEQAQIFYVSIGVISFVLLGILTNIVFPLYGIDQLSVFGPSLAMLIFSTLTAYAIAAHHLMDIWLVVRMGTIFSLVFATIIFVYIAIVGLLSRYTGLGSTHSLIIASLIITLTFEPLKRFIERATDRIFFHAHYNFDTVIEELTSTVHAVSLDLGRILSVFNELVKRNFKVDRAAVAVLTSKDTFLASSPNDGAWKDFELLPGDPLVEFLKANEGFILNRDEVLHGLEHGSVQLDVDRIDLVPQAYEELVWLDFTLAIPISLDGQLIAVYLIGAKSSNDLFTTEDLRLLDHLTSEAGVLINNARLYGDLKKLDEAKSNFISVASHQLRTPLSAVRWSTELLLDGTVDPKAQQEFLKDTYKNSLFVIERLDDMLTALDVEDKKLELKKEACSLRPLIDEIMKENDSLVRTKKINLAVNFEAGSDTLWCDIRKMKKMLEVLLTNAFWYVPESGGSVSLAVQKRTYGNEPLWEISVTDNGIGVSPEEQRYMFEKFFRGEAAKRMSPNGFGLGLFIVRAFARAHGGDAHFESAGRGKGSKFYFTIKREQEKKDHA